MHPSHPLSPSRTRALFWVFLAVIFARLHALDLAGIVPNAEAYLDPDSGLTCDVLDSVGCTAGAPPNAFGDGLAATGRVWTPELCAADSDGDGQSNGEELGDPCCLWTPGSTPTRTTNLSHPGDPSDTNTAPAVNCSAITVPEDDDSDSEDDDSDSEDDEPLPSPDPGSPVAPTVSVRPPRRSPRPSISPVMPTVTPSVSASMSTPVMDFDPAEADDEDPAAATTPPAEAEESDDPPPFLPPLTSPTMSMSMSASASPSASAAELGPGVGVGEESPEVSASPEADDGPPCFPADALVRVKNSDGLSEKRMADIVVGDIVHVGGGEYSRVFMLSHADARTSTLREFTQLTTASGHKLTLTAGHYLYAYAGDAKKLTRADGVQAGRHNVVTEDGEKTAVVKTETVWKTGLYNPQTLHGDIVVDGVVASTYTTAVHPPTAHSLLAPLRALFRALRASTASLESGKHGRGWLRVLPGGEAEL